MQSTRAGQPCLLMFRSGVSKFKRDLSSVSLQIIVSSSSSFTVIDIKKVKEIYSLNVKYDCKSRKSHHKKVEILLGYNYQNINVNIIVHKHTEFKNVIEMDMEVAVGLSPLTQEVH